jgi:hypothetical protein
MFIKKEPRLFFRNNFTAVVLLLSDRFITIEWLVVFTGGAFLILVIILQSETQNVRLSLMKSYFSACWWQSCSYWRSEAEFFKDKRLQVSILCLL